VFDTSATQAEVYDYAAASVIDSVIEGFNGTIFAYGQTASGKTHTMEGEIGEKLGEQSGIIPRMVMHVFNSISKAYENIEFRIKVSLTELYMEKLRDLLDQNKNDLKIRSDKKRGVFIEDLTEKYISSPEEVYRIIDTARNFRSIAVTNMNERSSRSHMIFILTISQNNTDDLTAKTGKLYLVDLAGSEKISKTGA
jgi:kinesin family protein 5